MFGILGWNDLFTFNNNIDIWLGGQGDSSFTTEVHREPDGDEHYNGDKDSFGNIIPLAYHRRPHCILWTHKLDPAVPFFTWQFALPS